MDMIVSIGSRTETVRVTPRADGRFDVTVGSAQYTISRARLGNLESILDESGLQREVSIRPSGPDTWQIGTRDGVREAKIVDPLTHLAEKATTAGGSRRRQRVLAYMPGRVVQVLVAEGAEVVAGQGIVVLEAMKMQNEIQAEHPGTITKFHVEPGRTVEGGDPLFDLE